MTSMTGDSKSEGFDAEAEVEARFSHAGGEKIPVPAEDDFASLGQDLQVATGVLCVLFRVGTPEKTPVLPKEVVAALFQQARVGQWESAIADLIRVAFYNLDPESVKFSGSFPDKLDDDFPTEFKST
jgi:hypothetical protein